MTNLLERTVGLLDATLDRGMTLAEIARTAGEPVAYDWLKKFAAGQIDDPSVNRVQALHDCLLRLERSAA